MPDILSKLSGKDNPQAVVGVFEEWSTTLDGLDRNAAGIWLVAERLREYAESSPSIVTPLNRYLGYEEAASIAKQSLEERRTIREVVIERGHVGSGRITEEQLDEALDVMRMTHP